LKKVITGNEAAAYGVLLAQPAVIAAYPITPQSRIPEQIAEFTAEGLLKGKFVNVESEMASLAYVTGASISGVRTFTATAGPGLTWMHEEIHSAATARLPIVMAIVNRGLHSLMCGWIDSLCERDSGWAQFYCESNQEVLDTILQAYRVAESVFMPVMVCLDGVYLSYLMESVDIPDQDKVDEYLPPYDPSRGQLAGQRLLKRHMKHPPQAGGYAPSRGEDMTGGTGPGNNYQQHKLAIQCLEEAARANEEFEAIFGRSYPLVEEYRCDDADVVLVAIGSAAGTSRYVIDDLQARGYRVGLVKLRMFRPFPAELVRKSLSGRKKVAIIERDISPGQCGIFCQEIKWALYDGTPIYGFCGFMGGQDITPQLIEKAIMYTIENEPQDVIWLGLEEKGEVDDYDRKSINVY